MSSILKVSEIQDPTNGNSALTVDSTGRVLTPAKGTFFAYVDTSDSSDTDYTSMTQVDDAVQHNIGNAFSI